MMIYEHKRVHIGKDIAKTAIRVLQNHNSDAVIWGDTYLLDEIAESYDKKLLDIHPLKRHPRILSALERSGLFEKQFIRLNGKRGNNLVRLMRVIKK